jgi:hypothetical protein
MTRPVEKAALLSALHDERQTVMRRCPPIATESTPLLFALANAARKAGNKPFLRWRGLRFPLTHDLSHTHVVCPLTETTLLRL